MAKLAVGRSPKAALACQRIRGEANVTHMMEMPAMSDDLLGLDLTGSALLGSALLGSVTRWC